MKKLFALTMILALCLSSVCCTAVADELPPYVISMITPLTSANAFGGNEYANGMNLALEHIGGEINGRKIVAAIADGPDAESTLSEFERLYNKGSRLFLSGYGNSCDRTFSSMCDEMEVLYLSLNWAADLTEDESDYFFRVGAAVTDFCKAIADGAAYIGENYLGKSADELKIAIVYGTNLTYMVDYIVDYAKANGTKIVLCEGVASDATDFVPAVTKLMESDYDIFVPLQQQADGTNFQTTMHELGYKPNVTMGGGIYYDLPVFADLGNEITDGCLSVSFPVPFMSESAAKGIAKFKKDYEEQFGHIPLTHALQAYGCMQAIFEVLKRVDPSQWEDTKLLADTLRELDLDYGELSWYWGIKFDELNNNVRADRFIIGQWVNGEYLCVGPEDLASSEARIPFGK